MKATDANKISIKQYLADKGILPSQDKGHYGMYHSSYREDNTPSLKVDFQQNLWYDFGLGKGGTIIDLIMEMNNCTFYEAITQLEREYGSSSFSSHGIETHIQSAPKIEIIKVLPIINTALLEYASERAIISEVLREHCKEVHYQNNGKSYFAIGFRNDSGGWALRNRYFKGCYSPMDITTIDRNSATCLVFEGFMDYLSYQMSIENETQSSNYVILNSTSQLAKAIPFLRQQKSISTFFDNDEGGRRATEVVSNLGVNHSDCSSLYAQYNDLNEYLCAKRLANNTSSLQVTKADAEKSRRVLAPKSRRFKL